MKAFRKVTTKIKFINRFKNKKEFIKERVNKVALGDFESQEEFIYKISQKIKKVNLFELLLNIS